MKTSVASPKERMRREELRERENLTGERDEERDYGARLEESIGPEVR